MPASLRLGSLAPLLLLAALGGCLGPASDEIPDPTGRSEALEHILRFDEPVPLPMDVGSYRWGFEPSVALHGDTVYLTAAKGVVAGGPPEASWLWVSDDAGKTFRTVADVSAEGAARSPEGAEGHIDVNADGTAYFVELTLAGIPVSRSLDDGRTWELRTPAANALPGGDRQWVAAGGGDTVYVVWNQLPTGYWIFASQDGGRTFPVQTELSRAVPAEDQDAADTGATAGTPIVAPDGSLFVARAEQGHGVGVYKSTDGAQSFSRTKAFDGAFSLFPVITVDEAGTIYVVAVDEGLDQAVYSYSTDGGATFSPVRPVTPEREGLQVMAWGAAARAGTLAVAWYEAEAEGDPNEVDTDWFIASALSTDAARDDAVFTAARVRDAPVHVGAVCTEGLTGCSGDARNLGDYLGVDVAPDGRVQVTWTDSTKGGQQQTIATATGHLTSLSAD